MENKDSIRNVMHRIPGALLHASILTCEC